MIDNFNIIKTLMSFGENDNLFMHLQILRRGKDHPGLPAANKLIKSWLVRSVEHLDSIKDEIIFLCEHYKARAYIGCVPKSIAKLNQLIMRKLADNQYTGNVINPWHVFNSACGELPGVEKRWVMDIDTKGPDVWESIDNCIDAIWLKVHPEDWGRKRGETWYIVGIPTLNGVHYIVRPFNLQEFKRLFPDVEVKKNGLTVLYVPESITSKQDPCE